jgi:hypothetical protein
VYEDQIPLKKSYEKEHSYSPKVEEQLEQHGQNVRKSENKVSYELKTKRDKVLALRKLEERHGKKKKIEGRPRVERRKKG